MQTITVTTGFPTKVLTVKSGIGKPGEDGEDGQPGLPGEDGEDFTPSAIPDGSLTIAKTLNLQVVLDSKATPQDIADAIAAIDLVIADGELTIAKTDGLQAELNSKATPADIATAISAIDVTITDGELTIAKTAGLQAALDSKVTGFADPGTDRLLFWDDSADAYAALTASAPLTIGGTVIGVTQATETVAGKAEIATTTETTTGTDDTRYITPFKLAGRLTSVGIADTGWVALGTLNAPWSVVGGGTPSYRVKNGVLFLRGRLGATAAAGDTVNATALPATARPAVDTPNVIYGTAANLLNATITATGFILISHGSSAVGDVVISNFSPIAVG